jgi:hypothetical protein
VNISPGQDLAVQSERDLTVIARAAIAAMLIFNILGGLALGFTFDLHSALRPLVGIGAAAGVAAFYTVVRPRPNIAAASIAVIDLVLFSAVGVIFTYVTAAMGGPLLDKYLFAFDKALGFDWRDYLTLASFHPRIAAIGSLAYQSLKFQMILVTVLLGFTGDVVRLRGYVAAVVLSCLATGALSGLFPSVSAFIYLKISPDDFPNLTPAAGLVHLQDFEALRDGSLRVLSLSDPKGIITFPSFHAALGVIFTWAVWSVAWVRWPMLAVNLALIAATPIDGGHYLTDVLGGILIAVLAIVAVRGIVQRRRAANYAASSLPS